MNMITTTTTTTTTGTSSSNDNDTSTGKDVDNDNEYNKNKNRNATSTSTNNNPNFSANTNRSMNVNENEKMNRDILGNERQHEKQQHHRQQQQQQSSSSAVSSSAVSSFLYLKPYRRRKRDTYLNHLKYKKFKNNHPHQHQHQQQKQKHSLYWSDAFKKIAMFSASISINTTTTNTANTNTTAAATTTTTTSNYNTTIDKTSNNDTTNNDNHYKKQKKEQKQTLTQSLAATAQAYQHKIRYRYKLRHEYKHKYKCKYKYKYNTKFVFACIMILLMTCIHPTMSFSLSSVPTSTPSTSLTTKTNNNTNVDINDNTNTNTYSPSSQPTTQHPSVVPSSQTATPIGIAIMVPSSSIPTTSRPSIPRNSNSSGGGSGNGSGSTTEQPSSFDSTSGSSSNPSSAPIISLSITTQEPTSTSTSKPTASPTLKPTSNPTLKPTLDPSSNPTSKPTSNPTLDPSSKPTVTPTLNPTSSTGIIYGYSIKAEMNVNGPNEKFVSMERIELWEQLTINFLLLKILANQQQNGYAIDRILLLDVTLDKQFDVDGRRLANSTSTDTGSYNYNDHGSGSGGSSSSSPSSIISEGDNKERQLQRLKKGSTSPMENQQMRVHAHAHKTTKVIQTRNEEKGILLLQFTINISFKTININTLMNKDIIQSYITDAFDSENDRQLYILSMKKEPQLSSFDSISLEVKKVHQITPLVGIPPNKSIPLTTIIVGTTAGTFVFIFGLLVIYLRWNKLWFFSDKDEYFVRGQHIPLADQNSSLPSHQSRRSHQSSLASIPVSITTGFPTVATTTVALANSQQNFRSQQSFASGGGGGSSGTSGGQQSILQPSGSSWNRQHDEELGFIEEGEDTRYSKREVKKRKQSSSMSFEYSLSDHGSTSLDVNTMNMSQQSLNRMKQGGQTKLISSSSVSSSRSRSKPLTTIDNETFFSSSRNEDIEGENFFRAPSSLPQPTSRRQKKVVATKGTFSALPSKTPFDVRSPDQGLDPDLYFFKDGPNIPKSSSSSGSSSSNSSTVKFRSGTFGAATSPPLGQTPIRTRPATVISTGSSRNSSKNSSAVSSMGVEELHMSSPLSGQVSFFSSDDESSLEKLGKSEIVELTAPPGVLGLVIDTVHGGIPTVFSVKEESVIADKVKEGDRLISVNGVDTTELSARNVSKVISRFKDSERTMIFFRQKPSNENMQ